MVRTESTMAPLQSTAPDFALLEPKTGNIVALRDFAGQPLLVMFICNHCPYVQRLREGLAEFAKEYQARGLGIVAINSNDIEKYPDDSPEKMIEEVENFNYTFPYLFDETQEVAKAYQAACTPDFFLYNAEHKLVYRGQFDDARPRNEVPVTGKDLRAAADMMLSGQEISSEQLPSMGCNIKWKEGNAPAYFG
jgi:thiol-disulfide isomerase/thioredoxin